MCRLYLVGFHFFYWFLCCVTIRLACAHIVSICAMMYRIAFHLPFFCRRISNHNQKAREKNTLMLLLLIWMPCNCNAIIDYHWQFHIRLRNHFDSDAVGIDFSSLISKYSNIFGEKFRNYNQSSSDSCSFHRCYTVNSFDVDTLRRANK